MRANPAHLFIVWVLLVVASFTPGLAQAQTPPDALLGGQVEQSVVSNQCYIARGSSEFQRNGAGAKAVVTFPEMVAAGYPLNGQMLLTFGTSVGGSVRFDYATAYPANIQVVSFRAYGQAYNSTTKILTVHFSVIFPGCTLPVHATYYSP